MWPNLESVEQHTIFTPKYFLLQEMSLLVVVTENSIPWGPFFLRLYVFIVHVYVELDRYVSSVEVHESCQQE